MERAGNETGWLESWVVWLIGSGLEAVESL